MAKKLVLAVAGSGKTSMILSAVEDGRRALIVTYTNENLRALESGLVKKFGCVPDNITLISYFSFLYSFCFRPFFSYGLRDNGIFWELPGVFPAKAKIAHYMSKGRYLYGNRIGKYIQEHNGIPKNISRLEKHFDVLYVDEIQDFAANDFNLLLKLTQANIDFLFVGDYFQHTFDTSRDGNIRTNLHKNGLEPYLKEFEDVGFEIDTKTLSKSHRCSPSVCGFISEHVGIAMESHRDDKTEVVVVEDAKTAQRLHSDQTKVKLFFQEHSKFGCRSNNWGKCKGINTYVDTCVVMNAKTAKCFESGNLADLPDSTRNKFYVACSRAGGDLYLLFEKHLREFKN